MYAEPKYIPGEKVLVRSNEEEEVLVGTFKEWEHHPTGTSKLPIVTVDGKDLLCFATVCAYFDELYKALLCMDGKEGWYWLLEQKRKRES